MARTNVYIRAEGIPAIAAGLTKVGQTIQSPEVVKIVQTGAEQMAGAAKRLAVRGATGNLQRGIYTASTLKNNFVALRRRNGRRVNAPLRYPARKGQVLVISSVYYGMFVEKGRTDRAADPRNRKPQLRRAVGPQFSGLKAGRPFFRPGIRQGKPGAERYIATSLEKLIRNVQVVE